MPYAYSNNGQSMRAIDQNDEIMTGEVIFPEEPDTEELKKAFSGYDQAIDKIATLSKINDLEIQATERRMREAVLGIDNGWLKNINDQISGLRALLS